MIDEIKSFVATFLGAICAGWLSKMATLLTDPIVSLAYQYAWRGGCIMVAIVAVVIIKQMYEDYMGYVAMGLFAIPAIAMLFVPWDVAHVLFGFSLLGLAIMGKKTIFG